VTPSVIEKPKSAAAAPGAMSANAATKIDILCNMFILVVMRDSPDRSGPRAPLRGLSPRPRKSISQTVKRSSS
jgi:hypothetical protein